MKVRNPEPRRVFALAVTVMVVSPALVAQDVAGNKLALEEIVVTAQKREQTLREIPVTVDVLGREMLERTITKDFSQIGNLVSGLEISGSQDGFATAIRVRGIGNNPNSTAISPSVGIFIDDIALSRLDAAFTNLVDLERIEVLKGPQSTLFGRGVSSGAILLNTRRPEFESTEGFVETTQATEGQQLYRVGGNLPLSDTLAGRGSLYYEEKDGYYRDTSHGEDESQLENAGGRMRFLWQPNDDFSAMLGYEQHNLKTDGAGRAVLGPYGDYYDSIAQYDPSVVLHEDNDLSDRKTQDGVYLHRERDFYLGSLRMDWTINSSWDLTSLTGYQDWKSTMDSSRSAANIGFNSSIGPGPYWLNPGFSIEKSKQFSEELRFAYSSDKLSSIIGLYYSDSDTNGSDTDVARTSRVFPAAGGGPGAQLISVALDTAGTGSSEEWAIFSHNIYSLTDRWDITLGLRYTSVEVTGDGHTRWGGEYTYLQSPIIPITPSSWEVPTNRKTFDEVTGALKASYQASEEVSLYASYNRGFKPGGFGTSDQDFDDFSGTLYTPATAYDSETSDAFELGMKSLMLDHTFSLNIAAFYQVYDDYQVQSIDPVTLQAVISNAKEVIVQGGDIGYEWLATPNLTFDGNAAYIDSTYDDFKDSVCARPQWAAIACADGGKQDLSGERLNQVSPWSATLNATWHDTLDNGMGWYLRGEYVYRGNRYLMEDLDPGAHDGQYQLLNASLGLSAVDERWTAILWAKNITDATYMVAAGTNADGETYAGLQVVANEPRTFGATLRYRF